MTPRSLDPLRFPLTGSQLIEASAGTGKTYTIAALYVRLVLGHGSEAAFARPLTPPEILVVTFTEAATQELRDRIRHRLADAANAFLATPDDAPTGDALLDALRADIPPDHWPTCARRLQLAAEWMDEAAVSTIHGWCNRMLREHAFDSGSLFTQALETDQSELLAEVVRDYWRCHMVPLGTEAAAEVLRWWATPEALQTEIGALIGHTGDLASADAAPAELLHRVLGERAAALQDLKTPWADWVDALQALLDEARERKAFNGTKLKKNNYDSWLARLAAWRDDPDSLDPGLTDAAKTRLTDAGLREVWKDGTPPQHPALDALAALDDKLAALPVARNDLLIHAAHWVAERFALEQQRRAQMGFDDLLTRLAAALAGPNGAALAGRIRASFPVALIDEFQDTDPVQYAIFDAIYRIDAPPADTALVLIGDPKQAIYAFRGADIHTYLVARRACAGRLHTLGRNYRSTAAMVAAANRCFRFAEDRPDGEGAFLFNAMGDNPVPFVDAEAQGRKTAFRLAGQTPPALTAWWLAPTDDGKPVAKGSYIHTLAEACATEMVRLLAFGQAGEAAFVGPDGTQPLRPAHMAVLVNNRNEAAAIRGALAVRGVRSVYLSDRDSVLATAQAADLQHWLTACAEPDDPQRLRTALATPTLALDWPTLDTFNHDETAWEARVLQFRAYRDCWRQQGVLPMLRRLLNDFGLPARLIAAPGEGQASGERALTDLLHLAELLQQASAEIDGEHALIRHLAELRADARAGSDARQIRLESDADLVQVVTVHKSKGLEYPLVFLPFACSYREVSISDLPLKTHDADGRLRLHLDGDEAIRQRADRERLGEDIRKLYVALTRARYATWVGLAPIAGLEKSAFGTLLGGGAPIAPDGLAAALTELADGCTAIAVSPAPPPTADRLPPATEHIAPGPARQPLRAVREHWWVASYSAIKAGRAATPPAGRPAADTPDEDVLAELQATPDAPAPARPTTPAGAATLHGFPRGAEVGSFLHELLEWAARIGFATAASSPALLREAITRRCQPRGWAAWADALTDWLSAFLTTRWRLPGTEMSLATLDGAVAELEFWVEAHAVDTLALDRLVCAHTLGGMARPPLQPDQLNGMLKGFIDLVFEHQGRYYVADYKSNWLGPDDTAYTPAALTAAIAEARYDLQYVLYTFALHRLLAARLPDYDYARHVGGAVYLFLRGSDAASQGLHVERVPRALIDALDALFSARPAKEVA